MIKGAFTENERKCVPEQKKDKNKSSLPFYSSAANISVADEEADLIV